MAVAGTQGSAKGTGKSGKQSSGELTAAQAAASAVGQVADLTTKDPVGATGVQPTDDGWRVEVEVLEEAHIPSTSDLMALYEVDLDLNGELLAYRRTRHYVRGRGDRGDTGNGGSR